MTDKHKR